MSLPRAILLPFALAATVWAQEKPLGLPKDSPFTDRRKPAAQVAAASETIEFAGVSAMGKRTDLIIHDKSTKKSHWIAEGETKEGISVLKYDARREQVVVKVNGTEKILQLRKGSGPLNSAHAVAPVPVGFNVPPAPGAIVQKIQPPPPGSSAPASAEVAATPAMQPVAKPEAPATPEVQQKQETEARMLVSDLLEIGMAQRKAYEDAQRRAATGESAPPAAAAGAPPPTNTQPEKP